VTEPVRTTATRAASRPRVRHGFFAVALLAVAGLRLADGDMVWAAVLGAAGLVEAGLAVAARTGAPDPRTQDMSDASGAEERAADAGLPEPTVVDRSLAGRRRHQRVWLFGVCVCTVAAMSLLPSEPAIASVLAVLALVSLHRVRRERRSVAALHRLAILQKAARSGRPTTEGSA
jgi:hypothetical protein